MMIGILYEQVWVQGGQKSDVKEVERNNHFLSPTPTWWVAEAKKVS